MVSKYKWTETDDNKAKMWDEVSLLTETEAAFLWVGLWPSDYNSKSIISLSECVHNRRLAAQRLIKEEMERGKIQCRVEEHHNERGHVSIPPENSPVCKLSRVELVSMATQRKHYPLTLFPEQRDLNVATFPAY